MLEKTRSRNRIKKTKRKTPDEIIHLDRVASLGCIICGSPASIHHIRTGMGMGQRAGHFDVLPLCHRHHQGADGIHTIGTKVWQKKYGTEIELLKKVNQKI